MNEIRMVDPSRKVSLTSRDLKLMKILYQSVALSFPQFGRKVFQGRAKSTVLNRLARLEEAGLIRRMRVQGFAGEGTLASVRAVFQLSTHGVRELSKVHGSIVERHDPIRIHAQSLSHDLLLVDVADALTTRFPGARITDGRLSKRAGTPLQAKPDLILEFASGEKPWAIELELTPKSEKRYRDIVLRYRLSREFDRVLYVTDSKQVITRLTKILEGKFMKLESKDPSKFIHMSLEGVLGKTANPYLKGGNA